MDKHHKLRCSLLPERGSRAFWLTNSKTGRVIPFRVDKKPVAYEVTSGGTTVGTIRLGGRFDPVHPIRLWRATVGFQFFWNILCSEYDLPPSLTVVTDSPLRLLPFLDVDLPCDGYIDISGAWHSRREVIAADT